MYGYLPSTIKTTTLAETTLPYSTQNAKNLASSYRPLLNNLLSSRWLHCCAQRDGGFFPLSRSSFVVVRPGKNPLPDPRCPLKSWCLRHKQPTTVSHQLLLALLRKPKRQRPPLPAPITTKNLRISRPWSPRSTKPSMIMRRPRASQRCKSVHCGSLRPVHHSHELQQDVKTR